MNPRADSHQVISSLAHSQLYQDFERSFNELTGLPVNVRPVESWQLPHHGRKHENPFCAMMAERSRTCGACLLTQQRLTEAAQTAPATVRCPFGLCESAVPIRTGNKTIGYLQTGQLFLHPPTEAQFGRAARLAREGGVTVDEAALRAAYFNSPLLTARRHHAAVNLLHGFAGHLGMVSNQLMVRNENAEPPVIARARQFIEEHHQQDMSLGMVAKAVNVSTFYFCKIFKKATGVTFTEYVSRLRTEKAKHLLLNPHLRISEIANEVGFQSLTHFNRNFKRLAGQSPTEYRGHLPAA